MATSALQVSRGSRLRSAVGPAHAWWVFNVWGSADLLLAFYQGVRVDLEPGSLGAAFFIVTVWVPLLLCTHTIVFMLLLRHHSRWAA